MTPPDLPGFTYLDLLGSGGFADVYLYEQQLPKRRVAVKVLLTDRISSASVEEFTAEANVMAMLSTHPAIVTIYQAGVARDGRPYLVMEYCPKPNLQVRYRREPFSVAESLRVGIQVAAAVETAHRAGVLHRDIKPANILVTEYNRPALTDFGIASTTSAAAESAGLSIPWSPPESFADVPRSDPRSDVYALGATVYTLLAGRSPFELPGQRNGAAELIQRIETMPLPALGRADTPVSLQRALERAMAKPSADRYESAIAFARALQKVQIELSHGVTAIDILDDHVPEDVEQDEDDGLTRVRGVVSIDPETAPAAGLTRPSATTAPSGSPFAPQSGPEPAVDATIVRAPTAAPAPDAVDATMRRASSSTAPAGLDGTGLDQTGLDETVIRGRDFTAAPTRPQVAGDVPAGADVAATASSAWGPGAADRPAVPAFDAPAPGDTAGSARRRPRLGLWIGLAAGLVVVAGVIVGVSLPGILSGGAAEPAPSATAARPQDPISTVVPPPEDLTGTAAAEGVRFAWTNPDPADGDHYIVAVIDRTGATGEPESVDSPDYTVPADPSGTTCVEVMLVRENGRASEPVTECVP
nr:serine/threonine-protein kinase [Microbacterium cremeum]